MKKVCLLLSFLLSVPLFAASDENAAALYDAAYKLYADGRYYDAGKKFEEVELEAGDPLIRANSLRAQIGAWKMCGLLYREYTAIEKLLENYPEYADAGQLAAREYEIAELYYQGQREPAFWQLRWIPWLHDSDKSIEIYTKALTRAPFAEWSPQAALRLAYLLDKEGMKKEAAAQLENFVANYPSSELFKYGLLALANAYMDLAASGDGDGKYISLAFDRLLEFQKKFPDDKENEWVVRQIAQYRDMQSERLLDLAGFYAKTGRTDASERYLAKILADYPDSKSAPAAEKMMLELDDTFIPVSTSGEPRETLPQIKAYSIPLEADRILIVPGQNGNHYLRPVPDLKQEVQSAPQKGDEK